MTRTARGDCLGLLFSCLKSVAALPWKQRHMPIRIQLWVLNPLAEWAIRLHWQRRLLLAVLNLKLNVDWRTLANGLDRHPTIVFGRCENNAAIMFNDRLVLPSLPARSIGRYTDYWKQLHFYEEVKIHLIRRKGIVRFSLPASDFRVLYPVSRNLEAVLPAY